MVTTTVDNILKVYIYNNTIFFTLKLSKVQNNIATCKHIIYNRSLNRPAERDTIDITVSRRLISKQ